MYGKKGGDINMRWECKRCGKTYTTNLPSAKPTGGTCKKDSNGKMQPHSWGKKQ